MRDGAYIHLGHPENNDLGEGTLLRGIHAKNVSRVGITIVDFDPSDCC